MVINGIRLGLLTFLVCKVSLRGMSAVRRIRCIKMVRWSTSFV